MFISVAPVEDQRKVEDCPASTVEGSAVKLLITGAAGGGGGVVAVGAGGGGGGGGGTFFLHPTANSTSTDSSTSMPARDDSPARNNGNDARDLELSFILTISSFQIL
jgi:hypothetical protein